MPTGSGKEEQHKTNEIVTWIRYSIQWMTAYLVYPFVLIKNTLLALEKATIALFLDSGPW